MGLPSAAVVGDPVGEAGGTASTGSNASATGAVPGRDHGWQRASRSQFAQRSATGRRFLPGQELEMVQWGRAGREVDRDLWWTSMDLAGTHSLNASDVEVLEITKNNPPTWAQAALGAKRDGRAAR